MHDELIQRLRDIHPEQFGNEWDFAFACQQAMHEAANAIEELSNAGSIYGKAWTLGYDAGRDENSPRWISVEERLPEYFDYVLACYVQNGKQYVDLDCLYKNGDWLHTPKYNMLGNIGVITHWMPLPQPPKEETC